MCHHPIWQELTPFVEVKAAPAKPTIYSVEDCYETYGYSYIEAVLSNATAKGEFLDTRRIYYNLSFDDEEYVFYPDEYVNIDEEMTDVPYGFVDNEDFQTYKGRRVIYFSKGVSSGFLNPLRVFTLVLPPFTLR